MYIGDAAYSGTVQVQRQAAYCDTCPMSQECHCKGTPTYLLNLAKIKESIDIITRKGSHYCTVSIISGKLRLGPERNLSTKFQITEPLLFT